MLNCWGWEKKTARKRICKMHSIVCVCGQVMNKMSSMYVLATMSVASSCSIYAHILQCMEIAYQSQRSQSSQCFQSQTFFVMHAMYKGDGDDIAVWQTAYDARIKRRRRWHSWLTEMTNHTRYQFILCVFCNVECWTLIAILFFYFIFCSLLTLSSVIITGTNG